MREKLISIFCCPLGVLSLRDTEKEKVLATSLRKGFHLSSLRGECRFPLKEKKKNIKRRRLSPSPSFGLHNWPCEIALYLGVAMGQIMRSLWLRPVGDEGPTFFSSFGVPCLLPFGVAGQKTLIIGSSFLKRDPSELCKLFFLGPSG